MKFSKKYVKKPLRLFLNTFRNKKLGFILMMDVVFYLVFYIGFKVFAKQAMKIMKSLQNLNLGAIQNINNIDVEGANLLLEQLQSFLFYILSAVFVFILFILVVLTLIKGYEWSKIVNKKHELFDYVKLLVLNLIWFIIWIIIFAIPLSFIEKQAYLMRVYWIIPFILYFTLFLYMTYAKTKSIGKALKAPIKEGSLKLHKYASGIIIIILVLEIMYIILRMMNLQNRTINLFISAIVLLVILAVYKLYFYSIEKEL